jgi:hypothetical protein
MKWIAGSAAGLAMLVLAGCQRPATNATTPPVETHAAAAAPAAPPSSPQDAAGAKAFLDGLYAHYKTSKDNSFQPFDANSRDVFDADTIALMDADTKALKGELGAIDGDWLCDCQDFESLTATVAVQAATSTTARATSAFTDAMEKAQPPKHDTFELVKTAAGWRIHDMGTADQPSLRKVLTEEIAQLKAGNTPSGDGD